MSLYAAQATLIFGGAHLAENEGATKQDDTHEGRF